MHTAPREDHVEFVAPESGKHKCVARPASTGRKRRRFLHRTASLRLPGAFEYHRSDQPVIRGEYDRQNRSSIGFGVSMNGHTSLHDPARPSNQLYHRLQRRPAGAGSAARHCMGSPGLPSALSPDPARGFRSAAVSHTTLRCRHPSGPPDGPSLTRAGGRFVPAETCRA